MWEEETEELCVGGGGGNWSTGAGEEEWKPVGMGGR